MLGSPVCTEACTFLPARCSASQAASHEGAAPPAHLPGIQAGVDGVERQPHRPLRQRAGGQGWLAAGYAGAIIKHQVHRKSRQQLA